MRKKKDQPAGPPLDRADLEIVYRDPAELRDSARNAKLHPPEQIEALAQLMDSIGWTNPILLDEDDEIIAGHGRKKAALLRQRPRVPTIVLRGLSDEQRRVLRVADNKHGETGWDTARLAAELTDLSALSSAMLQLTGFSADELAAMSSDGAKAGDGGGAGSGAPGAGIEYQEKFAVLIDCANEAAQIEAYDKLVAMGYTCRVLVN